MTLGNLLITNVEAVIVGRRLSRAEIRHMKKIQQQVPVIECKGLCAEACQSVPITPVESYFLISTTGVKVQPAKPNPPGEWTPMLGRNTVCPFLQQGRCSIYNDRPLVCRIYGHPAMGVECKYGCKNNHPINDERAMQLLDQMWCVLSDAVPGYGFDQWIAEAGRMVIYDQDNYVASGYL